MTIEHSRRALLGGAGLALVAGTLPVVAAPSTASANTVIWDAVEAQYIRVRDRWHAEMKRFNGVETRYFAHPRQATEEEYDAAQEEEQRHCGLDNEAMKRLNETPAPHLRAVLLKLTLIDEFALPMAPVIADIRRLSGEAQA